MPFTSDKQRKFLWANEPEVAREFAGKEGTDRSFSAMLRAKKGAKRVLKDSKKESIWIKLNKKKGVV